MKELKFHPLAEIFPLLEEDWRTLQKDIIANGQLEPITLYQEQIPDGRLRYLACKAFDREPNFEQYQGSNPLSFVISKNIHRRHLTLSQRAVIAADIVTTKHGGNQYYTGDVGSAPANSSGKSAGPLWITQTLAAKMFNVSERLVRDAVRLKKEAQPDIITQVRNGTMAINEAIRTLYVETVGETSNQFTDDRLKRFSPKERTIIDDVIRELMIDVMVNSDATKEDEIEGVIDQKEGEKEKIKTRFARAALRAVDVDPDSVKALQFRGFKKPRKFHSTDSFTTAFMGEMAKYALLWSKHLKEIVQHKDKLEPETRAKAIKLLHKLSYDLRIFASELEDGIYDESKTIDGDDTKE